MFYYPHILIAMIVSWMSLNVSGLRDENERLAVLQWISHLSLDYVCLQKTYVISLSESSSWFSSYGFSSVVSPGNVYSCGAVILCHPVYSLRDFQTDDCGRLFLAEFQIRESLFRIACMLLIKNRKEINFVAMFPPPLIRLSPQCFMATSTL